MKAKSASFFSAQKGRIDHSTAIVTLITKQKNTGKILFIGTAFYITSGGLLMTAKHNLFGKDGKLFENIAILHFHDKKFIVRQISRACHSNSYDIAYLLPWMKLNNKGMSKTQTLSLTTNLPNRGDQLALYGYPETKLEYDLSTTTIDMNPEFYLGSFVEFHENGFGLLRNPCFQTSIRIKSGASGAPVFDRKGKVFAVASTGIDLNDGGEDISFVTPIKPSFDLKIEDGGGNKHNLRIGRKRTSKIAQYLVPSLDIWLFTKDIKLDKIT